MCESSAKAAGIRLSACQRLPGRVNYGLGNDCRGSVIAQRVDRQDVLPAAAAQLRGELILARIDQDRQTVVALVYPRGIYSSSDSSSNSQCAATPASRPPTVWLTMALPVCWRQPRTSIMETWVLR